MQNHNQSLRRASIAVTGPVPAQTNTPYAQSTLVHRHHHTHPRVREAGSPYNHAYENLGRKSESSNTTPTIGRAVLAGGSVAGAGMGLSLGLGLGIGGYGTEVAGCGVEKDGGGGIWMTRRYSENDVGSGGSGSGSA
jgi:hypothetical protein